MAAKKPPWDVPRTTAEVVGALRPDGRDVDLASAFDGFGRPAAPAPVAASVVVEPARIEFQTNGSAVNSRALVADVTSVGRHTDNVIQLLDPEVSKAHLVVRRHRDGYFLEDLGSANGTLVNGVRQSRCKLVEGDIIVVGNSTLRFKEARRKAPTRPAEQASVPPRAVDVRPPMKPGSVGFGNTPPQPLTSFAEVRRSDTGLERVRRPPPAERTSVTLVPADLLSDPGSDSVFTEQPAELAFAEVGAVRDERALQRDYERLRVAFDLFTGIGLETDLENLGQLILQKIRGVLACDSAVIMLRDASISDDLVTLTSWSEKNQAVNIPRAIVERVLRTKGGLLTSDAQVDSQLRRSETIVGAKIRSALCMPLVARDEVLGVIHLSSTSLAGAFEEKDLALLRAIAQPAALAVANARLRIKIEQEAATRAELSRFLSPALVEKAVSNEFDFTKAGDLVTATVLFSDIRGFTTISDGAAPQHVVSMLNEYFDAMVEVVFAHGGTLDKFLGDGLMAVWGTPVQSPDDAVRAVHAANAMRVALRDVVNAARAERGESPLSVGYGIATGKVVAGAMGARRRLDFTVIGDTVNLSSRLCGQASAGQVLIDEHTERAVRGSGLTCLALEARQVKGVARPVPVFDVILDEGSASSTTSMEMPTLPYLART
jgi:adenylate cyclase